MFSLEYPIVVEYTPMCIRTIVVNKQGREVFARYPTVVVGVVAVLQLLKAFLDNVV